MVWFKRKREPSVDDSTPVTELLSPTVLVECFQERELLIGLLKQAVEGLNSCLNGALQLHAVNESGVLLGILEQTKVVLLEKFQEGEYNVEHV